MERNKWKNFFFLLLSFNIAIILFISSSLFILINKPIEENESDKEFLYQNRDDIFFQIRTNKRDLNRIIHHYIKEEFSGNIDYRLLLKDQVELHGSLSIYGFIVDLKMTFEPVVLRNGDIELHQKEMYIGKLRIPPSLVLKLIENSYRFPNWVIIEPNEEKIYVSIQDLKLKSDLKVRVERFDLKRDIIKFSFQLPL